MSEDFPEPAMPTMITQTGIFSPLSNRATTGGSFGSGGGIASWSCGCPKEAAAEEAGADIILLLDSMELKKTWDDSSFKAGNEQSIFVPSFPIIMQ
jgi:hypothetical protein